MRSWGDCYGHCLVATGRADVMLDPVMNPWDCAALLPIVREAGGRFTDWSGAARIDGGDAVSTNGGLHAACWHCSRRLTYDEQVDGLEIRDDAMATMLDWTAASQSPNPKSRLCRRNDASTKLIAKSQYDG